MNYAPDTSSSEDDELSLMPDYEEYKEKTRNIRLAHFNKPQTESQREESRLNSIFNAIVKGNVETVIQDFDKGLDINTDLQFGWTPLLAASSVANVELIREFIKRGANVNQDRDGSTPLFLVCDTFIENESTAENALTAAKLLIENGANVNAIDRKRRTPLMLAASKGHFEIVKLLLPLCNKFAEDNQRWTALFWAVDGNHPTIVELLLKEGLSCDTKDIRGDTIRVIALQNQIISNLLPEDPSNVDFIPLDHASSDVLNALQHLNTENGEKPQFLYEIYKILYAVKSERLFRIFADNNISWYDFFATTDSELKDLGIELPFQRRRIMGGLYRFHKHPFHPKSIPIVPRKALYTNVDVAGAAVSAIKQVMVMEASLKFIMKNCTDDLTEEESREIETKVKEIRPQIRRLRAVAKKLLQTSEEWDSSLKPVDRITKKRWNIPWGNLFLSFSTISLLLLIYKLH